MGEWPIMNYKSNPLHHMLNPDSVAFVGANNQPTTMGTVQMLHTLNFGYKGKIYPVHPKEKSVLGIKAYPSIRDIPEPVDLVVITVPARAVPNIFEDCASKGVHYAVVTSGGFSELGDEGRELEIQILELAHRYQIRFIGPNCLGILNPLHRLNLTMFSYKQPPGTMGLASQSGTYITQVIKYLEKRGVGYSRAISIGNKADIDLVDCLEYLGEDDETRAIALYIEGLKRPRMFLETAKKVSSAKPVVALYVGGTEAGARSSASHTGAICSPAKLYSDVFRQAGIIEAPTIEDLYQWTWALANQPIPRSNRIAILTHSGGPATSIADACNKNGLQVPRFSPKTLDAIKPLVPPTAAIENPVDLTFTTEPPLMAQILPPIILEDPNIDALIIHGLMVTSWMSDIKEAAGNLFEAIPIEQISEMVEGPIRELSRLPQKYNKPIICSSFVGPGIEVSTRKLHQFRIPTYDGPEKAVTAMSAMVRYNEIMKK
jgi:acetyltransferase